MTIETHEPTEPQPDFELAVVYDIVSGQPLVEAPPPPVSPYHPATRDIAGLLIRISE